MYNNVLWYGYLDYNDLYYRLLVYWGRLLLVMVDSIDMESKCNNDF